LPHFEPARILNHFDGFEHHREFGALALRGGAVVGLRRFRVVHALRSVPGFLTFTGVMPGRVSPASFFRMVCEVCRRLGRLPLSFLLGATLPPALPFLAASRSLRSSLSIPGADLQIKVGSCRTAERELRHHVIQSLTNHTGDFFTLAHADVAQRSAKVLPRHAAFFLATHKLS